jgi:hypothetical protein
VCYLEDIKLDLITFITVRRDRGMPVTCLMVSKKAGQMKPAFLKKTTQAQLQVVSRFLNQNSLVHWIATHTVQHSPKAIVGDA